MREQLRDDLSVCEILALAIQSEIEARRFYEGMANRADKPRIASTFAFLAQDERDHEEKLRQRSEADLCEPSPAGGPAIESVSGNFIETATELQALKIAIHGESRAREFYTWAAERTQDPEGKAMFKELAAVEASHQNLLEAEYKARGGQPWSEYELDTWVRE